MREFHRLLWMAVIVGLLTPSLVGCGRLPRGNWHIETGRARMETRQPVPETRLEALERAQEDARRKLLEYVEEMVAEGSTLVGDHMARDVLVSTRVQALIMAAPRFRTRFQDHMVEVDMGVDVDEVRSTVSGGPEPAQP